MIIRYTSLLARAQLDLFKIISSQKAKGDIKLPLDTISILPERLIYPIHPQAGGIQSTWEYL